MTPFQKKALAAQARRDDARAETRVRLGNSSRGYDGTTPAFIDGRTVFNARECGWNTRMRRGTVERKRGGGTKFKPYRDTDPPARVPAKSYGENVGHSLVNLDTQQSLVNRPASLPRPEGT